MQMLMLDVLWYVSLRGMIWSFGFQMRNLARPPLSLESPTVTFSLCKHCPGGSCCRCLSLFADLSWRPPPPGRGPHTALLPQCHQRTTSGPPPFKSQLKFFFCRVIRNLWCQFLQAKMSYLWEDIASTSSHVALWNKIIYMSCFVYQTSGLGGWKNEKLGFLKCSVNSL